MASAARDAECPSGNTPWWLAESVLQASGAHQDSLLPVTAYYRFGDAVLQIAADDPGLFVPIRQLYGECAVPAPVASEPPRVRCVVRHAACPPLVLVTFLHGAPSAPATVALGLLHPPRGDPPYAIHAAAIEDWWWVGGATQPVVAANGTHLLIDPQQVPEHFLVEYLVSATLAPQSDLLVVRAAALRVGSAAALIAGPSRAGKTTTAAHLAARGHALLGDEVAVLRLSTHDAIPLRRSLNLRSGPRSPELLAALARLAARTNSPMSNGRTGPLRLDELFSASPVHPARLQAAFFLSGFADEPSLEPFRLTLDDVSVFEDLAANDVAFISWGLTGAQRTLRVLALNQLLGRIRCWRLKLGSPGETAQLIERTMEGR